jgi:simple sugar transport system permease protein
VVRWTLTLVTATALYSGFLVLRGAAPLDVLSGMWNSAFGGPRAFGETLIRATPLVLAGLAVAVPARAGLFNIGGEGQLVMGAIGAAGTAYAVGTSLPTAVTLTLVALGGAAGGMAWALIPAILRAQFNTNEVIVSLLLNYVAVIALTWVVFAVWRDPKAAGQAYTTGLTGPQRLPVMWGDRVNIGIVMAVVAVPVVAWLLTRTRWGFRLLVAGGNLEAARRAGIGIRQLMLSSFALGGALAGLAGMIAVAGVEGRLRPDMLVGFGYIAFLASWLGRHQPFKVALAAVALGAIAVGGTGLKISSGLSGGAVNVLIALVLLAVLGWAQRPGRAA